MCVGKKPKRQFNKRDCFFACSRQGGQRQLYDYDDDWLYIDDWVSSAKLIRMRWKERTHNL